MNERLRNEIKWKVLDVRECHAKYGHRTEYGRLKYFRMLTLTCVVITAKLLNVPQLSSVLSHEHFCSALSIVEACAVRVTRVRYMFSLKM